MTATLKTTFDRDAQFAAKRRAVIVSAGAAFARGGYHNTSMTVIAQSLGLTKAALYYYVKNKEEVLFESHLIAYDAMDAVLKTSGARPQSCGLDSLVALYADFVNMLTGAGVSLLTDVNSLSEPSKSHVLARRAKIERKIIRIVKTGQKDGSIRAGDARLQVFFFMGALNWLNAWYSENGRVSGEAIAAHFSEQLRSGISAGQS